MTAATQQVSLVCPECGAPMTLIPSRFGPFYGCTEFRKTGCKGSHGSHADGRPLGLPAQEDTKKARIRAHAAFDSLWREEHVFHNRKGAYRWMRQALGLSKDEAHIGRFTIEQCDRLIAAVDELLEVKR